MSNTNKEVSFTDPITGGASHPRSGYRGLPWLRPAQPIGLIMTVPAAQLLVRLLKEIRDLPGVPAYKYRSCLEQALALAEKDPS